MNVQDECIKIHSKYGMSEMANYKIQLLFDSEIEKVKKEYEEKLRWIPVGEKRSPNWEHVLLKQSDGKITIGCYMSSQFNVEMCSDAIRVTHWRFIL